MQLADLAVVAGLVVAYGGISGRIAGGVVTPPMLFVVAGLVLGPGGFGVVALDIDDGLLRTLAEITLVLVLFSDAVRIDLRVLRREHRLPVRLLSLGLPMTIVLGAVVAAALFPGLALWEAALLAAVLAPTDAAVGQAVVSDDRVPVRMRQAVNVESGLNDGIALPVITVLVALAGGQLAGADGGGVRVVVEQLGFGAGVGLVGGWLGGTIVDVASARGWMSERLQQLSALAVGLGSFALASTLGGSGFIAAFTAGLAFGLVARERCDEVQTFTEEEGHLLTLLTFLAFGGALVIPALERTTPATLAYAAASLTVVRMVPVALALVGTGLRSASVVFLGWFGPRGLASIVFGLVVVEESGLAVAEQILDVVVWTVLVSVFAHGATAGPAARWYGTHVGEGRHGQDGPEHEPATSLPLRP